MATILGELCVLMYNFVYSNATIVIITIIICPPPSSPSVENASKLVLHDLAYHTTCLVQVHSSKQDVVIQDMIEIVDCSSLFMSLKRHIRSKQRQRIR